jgi:hypothetical protein
MSDDETDDLTPVEGRRRADGRNLLREKPRYPSLDIVSSSHPHPRTAWTREALA